MQNPKRALCIVLITFGVLMSGCASNTAPQGWLPAPSDSGKVSFGGWIEVGDVSKNRIAGELIALSEENIYVLTDSSLVPVPREGIQYAQVTAYNIEEETDRLKLVTGLGTLSTLSHGGYLVFSAPLWIIAGSATTGQFSHWPVIQYPKQPLAEMTKYARFPQGLPPGLDISSLKPKQMRVKNP